MMNSGLHDTAEVEWSIASTGGGRAVCTRSIGSAVIHVDLSQHAPVPDGYSLVSDFLDEIESHPNVKPHLREARKTIALERKQRGRKLSLRELRLTAGLSQSEFAAAIGTSQPMVSLLEARRQLPGEATLREMARALAVDFNTLMDALENA